MYIPTISDRDRKRLRFINRLLAPQRQCIKDKLRSPYLPLTNYVQQLLGAYRPLVGRWPPAAWAVKQLEGLLALLRCYHFLWQDPYGLYWSLWAIADRLANLPVTYSLESHLVGAYNRLVGSRLTEEDEDDLLRAFEPLLDYHQQQLDGYRLLVGQPSSTD